MTSLNTLDGPPAAAVAETAPSRGIDASMFLGTWVSTNRETQGIAALSIRDEDGRLIVRALGSGEPSLCDWGDAPAEVFADDPGSTRAYAFTARFDLGFRVTLFQAKMEKGVLVVANFNRFTDDSGRANYYSREFFFRRRAVDERSRRLEPSR